MELKIIPVIQVIIALILMTIIETIMPTFAYTMQLSIYPVAVLTLIGVFIGFLAIYSRRFYWLSGNL